MSDDPNNNIWQTLRPMHNFGVFCFALIMILKVFFPLISANLSVLLGQRNPKSSKIK